MHNPFHNLIKLHVLLKRKYFNIITIISLLFALLAFLYNMFVVVRHNNMVVEMNYPGSESGLNPDGSVFDISEFTSDVVLNKAKARLKHNDISNDDLRRRITIESEFDRDSLKDVGGAIEGGESAVYMPTTYYVYYSQQNKFTINESITFLEYLAEAYEDNFEERYSEKNNILEFNADDYDFSKKDYREIYRIFNNKVSSMIAYLNNHKNENASFIAGDGTNIGTMVEQLQSFRDVNLDKYEAFILQNGVSKDNRQYVQRVSYLIENNTNSFKKHDAASTIAKNALDEYDSKIAAIAFVPSIDASDSYYMNRTKTAIDDITETSYNEGVAASNVLKKLDYYNLLTEKFSLNINTPDANIETAEQMVNEMSEELEQLSDKVLAVDDEYLDHKTKNYFNITVPKSKNIINLRLIMRGFIAGAILSIFLVIMLEFFMPSLKARFTLIHQAFNIMRAAEHRKK